MAGGRPKIQLKDLPDNWKEELISLSQEGASAVEMRVYLGICQTTWERLIAEEPEFSLTIKKVREECETWWEKKGRKNLENKDFNATLWYMNMKNRFKWADRHDHTTGGEKFQPIDKVVVEVVTKSDET